MTIGEDMSTISDSLKQSFINSLKTDLDLNIADIQVMSVKESCFVAEKSDKPVPYLELFALSDSYDRIIGEPERMGLIDTHARSGILSIWSDLLDDSLEEKEMFFDEDMYIGAGRYETLCYKSFAYDKKEDVNRYLIQRLKTGPKKIYAESSPGINIIYESDDYNRLNIDLLKDELKAHIIEMAKESIERSCGQGIECNLTVKFWHPLMKGYNGYWLARED